MSCQFESGVVDGQDAVFVIYEHNPNTYDFRVTSFSTLIKGNKAESLWWFDYHDDTNQIATKPELDPHGKNYVPPQYYFMVVVDGVKVGENRESGLLVFKDFIEISLGVESGFAVADKTVTVTFADGSTKDEKLDDKGYAKITDTPPGPYSVELKSADSASIVKNPGGTAGAGSGAGTAGNGGGGSAGAGGAGSSGSSGTDAAGGDDTASGEEPEEEGVGSTSAEMKKGKYSIEKAVKYLNENYIRDSFGNGRCAYYVRMAIESGGITVYPRPKTGYASEFGPFLIDLGFKEIAGSSYNINSDPQKGDIAIIQPYPDQQPPAGHMTMFNGKNWISDFLQRDMWSGPKYRASTPDYKIYRWEE